jgi:hypothetical protein
VKLRIWKSLTFFIGLILFIAAFGVILLAGSIFNPPPYRIVVALEDIPPYTTLTRSMFAVDEQTMHARIASRLVHEAEIDQYLGGMAIETIHAGEPLRRNAVVAAGNPAAVHRLSLALTDPSLVAAVIPVDAKIVPDNVTAGDYVNITMGIAGNVSQMASATGGAAGWGAPPSLLTPTPTPVLTPALSLTTTSPIAPGYDLLPPTEEVPDVSPPLDKIVLPQVEVIDVSREKVPNPNYGMSFGEEGEQEPPFLEGDVESITVLVPQAAEELLYFAVDNGTLHISVVPHAAVLEGASPSTGVLWEDIVRFFQEERLQALGVITSTASLTATAPISGSVAPTRSPALPATPSPAPEGTVPTPTPSPPGGSGESPGVPTLGGFSGYLVPLCIGGGLVIGIGAVIFALARRRKGQGNETAVPWRGS